MTNLDVVEKSESNRHSVIVVAVFAVCGVAGFFLGFLPNTDPYHKRVARAAVSQLMIDPASARFGSVAVFGRGEAKFVCGGVKGKNRMGAYSGETRFIARAGSSAARLDPQIVTTVEMADQAKALCSEVKSSSYSSPSAIDSICSNSDQYARDLASQSLFEAEWNNQCT